MRFVQHLPDHVVETYLQSCDIPQWPIFCIVRFPISKDSIELFPTSGSMLAALGKKKVGLS
jgi:hypothetical protein